MGRLSIRKRFNQVAPMMLRKNTSTLEPTHLTADELEAKYHLGQSDVLDVAILPHPKTPEFKALSVLKSFHHRFTNTVIKSLNTLEESLTEMRDECSVCLMAFLPKAIPDPKEKDKVHPMTEMEALFFIMLETIRLVDEPLAKDQANFIRDCVAELTTLQNNVHALEILVNVHRKELKHHYRRLRNLYEACKLEYPKALDAAGELYTDYFINTEDAENQRLVAPLFSGLSSGIPGFSHQPTHRMKFRCQPNGYAVFTRFPESSPNWRDGITFNTATKTVMLGGIVAEFHVRVEFAKAALKTCLSRILRASQNLTEEKDYTGMRLETDKLYRLWDFRRLGISRGEKTTMLFYFMRVDRRLDLLNTSLYNLAQELMLLRNRLKYLKKNCSSWGLMRRKIIYGPVARNAEKLNYMKLEIPLSTQWTEECVRDFIFEVEPVPVVHKVREVIDQPDKVTSDIWHDFKPMPEVISTIGGGDATSKPGDTSSNETESYDDDDSEADLMDLGPEKRAKTRSWINLATPTSEMNAVEDSD